MAIESPSVEAYSGKTATQIVEESNNTLNKIVGESTFQGAVRGMFGSHNLVGMNTNQLDNFQNALRTYKNKIENIVAEFKETTEADTAFKGEVVEAVSNFIAAVKQLLNKYAASIQQEMSEVEHASEQLKAATSEIAQGAAGDADSIRSQASSIELDPLGGGGGGGR